MKGCGAMGEESPEKKARDLFSKIGQTLKSGAEVLVQETRELSKVGKLKIDLLSLENERSRKFEEIGNLAYRAYKSGQSLPSELAGLFQDIDEIEISMCAKSDEIEKLHREDEQMKKGDDEFEGNEAVVPDAPDPSSSPCQEPLFCPHCGSRLSPGDRFCRQCGTRVG